MTAAKPPKRSEVQIALGLTAVLLFVVVVLLTAVLDGARRFDFTSFYTGGLILRQGNAARLYDLGEQARIQRQLFNREISSIFIPLLKRYSSPRSPDFRTSRRTFSGERSMCCSGCSSSIFFGLTRQSPGTPYATSGSVPCFSRSGPPCSRGKPRCSCWSCSLSLLSASNGARISGRAYSWVWVCANFLLCFLLP